MKFLLILLVSILAAGPGAGDTQERDEARATFAFAGEPRFEAVDIFVDAGDASLGAYQVELKGIERKEARVGTAFVKIVGLEGGDHPAFGDAPYYDPEALQGGRVIVAAFSTAADLPAGRTRVARVHVMLEGAGEPAYELKIEAAADRGGKPIRAQASTERVTKEQSEGTDQ